MTQGNQKRLRYVIYSFNYLIAAIGLILFSDFMPVLLENVRGFNNEQQSLFILVVMFPLILKPFIALFIDKFKKLKQNRRLFLVVSDIIIFTSMFLMGIDLVNGNFLAFLFVTLGANIGISLTDVRSDEIIVEEELQDTTNVSFIVMLTTIVGWIAIYTFYLGFVGNDINTGWFPLFFASALFALPLIFLSAKLHNPVLERQPTRKSRDSHVMNSNQRNDRMKNSTKTAPKLILYIIFLLVLQAPAFGDYVFEPYIVSTYGGDAFASYNSVSLISNLFSLVILVIFWFKRYYFLSKRKLAFVVLLAITVITWVAPVTGSLAFINIMAFFEGPLFIAGTFYLFSTYMDAAPAKRGSALFQAFNTIYIGSGFIYRIIGIRIASISSDGMVFIFIAVISVIGMLLIQPLKFRDTLSLMK